MLFWLARFSVNNPNGIFYFTGVSIELLALFWRCSIYWFSCTCETFHTFPVAMKSLWIASVVISQFSPTVYFHDVFLFTCSRLEYAWNIYRWTLSNQQTKATHQPIVQNTYREWTKVFERFWFSIYISYKTTIFQIIILRSIDVPFWYLCYQQK